MTPETQEILTAGRECYAALEEAARIFARSRTKKVPKRIKQALERNKIILFGDHLAEK